MSLNQYLSELNQNLKHLTGPERDEALAYFKEYASEAGLDTYTSMAARFGTPRELASSIYADTAAKEVSRDKASPKASLSRGLWIGLAALAAFPFSLSAVVVICSIGFALAVSAGSILLSFLIAAAAVAAAGVGCFLHSLTLLIPFHGGAFLMSVGSFLILTPIGCALFILLLRLTKKILSAVICAVANYIHRRTAHEA